MLFRSRAALSLHQVRAALTAIGTGKWEPDGDQVGHNGGGLAQVEHPLAHSNSGNRNLRPETLGVTRREGSPERANPTAETGSPRTGHGNVALFPTRGNHVDLRGLGGGGRSRAKPVSAAYDRLGNRKKPTVSGDLALFGAPECPLFGGKRCFFNWLAQVRHAWSSERAAGRALERSVSS